MIAMTEKEAYERVKKLWGYHGQTSRFYHGPGKAGCKVGYYKRNSMGGLWVRVGKGRDWDEAFAAEIKGGR